MLNYAINRDLFRIYSMKTKTYWQENSYIKWPYGRHRGRYLREIPDSYLEWVIKNFQDPGLAQIAADELARRRPELRRL